MKIFIRDLKILTSKARSIPRKASPQSKRLKKIKVVLKKHAAKKAAIPVSRRDLLKGLQSAKGY